MAFGRDAAGVLRTSGQLFADAGVRVGEAAGVACSADNQGLLKWDPNPEAPTLMVCGLKGEDERAWVQVFSPPGPCDGVTLADATQKKVFTFTGSDETWEVPAGVKCILVLLWGAGGGGGGTNDGGCCGGDGGGGAGVEATFTVTPGEKLTVMVGQGMQFSVNNWGYGGGATGGGQASQRKGGSGGGFSRIDREGSTPIAVAGGGGGGNSRYVTGPEGSALGGAGGGLVGLQGEGSSTRPTGGTQTAGGSRGDGLQNNPNGCSDSENGVQWKGGRGLGYNSCDCSYGCPGGGGGGWYGGGGGNGGNGTRRRTACGGGGGG